MVKMVIERCPEKGKVAGGGGPKKVPPPTKDPDDAAEGV